MVLAVPAEAHPVVVEMTSVVGDVLQISLGFWNEESVI
jgi:hypothetical protein